jgi:hypothetical protein
MDRVADLRVQRQRGGLEIVLEQLDVGERRRAASRGVNETLAERVELRAVPPETEAIGRRVHVRGREARLCRDQQHGVLLRPLQPLDALSGPADQR